jgi:hypothetical protein
MARATIIDTVLRAGDFKIRALRHPLRVVKEKVFVQLDEEAPREESLWYLDSEATNHMSSCWGAFIDIDTAICGSVKFSDGSEVAIEGSDTVLFEGKTGEHIPLTGVFFIPRLTTNIVSLGQLDEDGCDVHTWPGVLEIHNDRGRLIARVHRSANRLYLLRVKIGRPLCLSPHASSDAWLWHERYGHLHFNALNKVKQRGMVHDILRINHIHQLCADCIATKMKRSPFPS